MTLSAQANPVGSLSWPNVQVAFVLETTPFDGVYDFDSGDVSDSCNWAPYLCEESNGACYFVSHAQLIANAIQAANPHSQVSFAMVDYFATLDNFDDGDGAEYHVDLPSFVTAGAFGSAVANAVPLTWGSSGTTLTGDCTYPDSDLSDNFLHSSSITALYGSITGSGLNWSAGTHHVIVWIGSTAPRDPAYTEDYCVSIFDSATAACYSPGCEPSYPFPGGLPSPNCEGWVRSLNGNGNDSIAALARTSPSCTNSVGGRCTLDMIDLYNGVTDPWSGAWPSGRSGGGPGGPLVEQNVARILLSACDLSAATGGTWNGPSFFTCPNGQTGSMQFSGFDSTTPADLTNPTLYAALRTIGFGPMPSGLVIGGGPAPMFQFVPYGNVRPAPVAVGGPQFESVCRLASGASWSGSGICPAVPQSMGAADAGQLGWNWSLDPSLNGMTVGDSWSVSFNVVANGPPYATIPIDVCSGYGCALAGSAPVGGGYTSAHFTVGGSAMAWVESFPVATLSVEYARQDAPPGSSAPAAPNSPGAGGGTSAVPSAVGALAVSAFNSPSGFIAQVIGAGVITAGFTRIAIRKPNQPIALRVRAPRPRGSKFEE
ncbi:MAG TPA: hypothetical protein VGV89_05795 [Thermoplasmata archaeon]|nr:hypothetical protein [Thermoplasmata archaeon]